MDHYLKIKRYVTELKFVRPASITANSPKKELFWALLHNSKTQIPN